MKRILILIIIILSFFMIDVHAEGLTAYITGNSVNFRACPNTSCNTLEKMYTGDVLILTNEYLYEGEGCPSKWYKGVFNGLEGYICSSYVKIDEPFVPLDPTSYATYKDMLVASGFTESYALKLAILHEKYPNWTFIPVTTNLNWSDVVSAQTIKGKSCLYTSEQGYYYTEEGTFDYLSDTFNTVDVNCYATNYDTNAYYLDPRNFMNERTIFMFEELTFNPNNHTIGAVTTILSGNTNLSPYINDFYNASTVTLPDNTIKTISPVHLASRSRQEIGNTSSAGLRVNGLYPYTYRNYNLKGYYNFYNIGSFKDAYTTMPSARGMAYACGSLCGFSDTYGRPWNTSLKGILGGAQFLIERYFLRGQDTIYFQKFNTSGWSTPYTNQYMQNIQAPSSEAGTTYSAYAKNTLLNNNITFKIPVYNNMPNETVLPNRGNPNNHLKDLKVNGVSIPSFSHDKNEYTISLPDNTTSVNLEGLIINPKTTISNTGIVNINKDINELNVLVTAENGLTNTYKIKIVYTPTNIIIMNPNDLLSSASIKSDGVYVLDILEGQLASELLSNLIKINSTSTIQIKSINGQIKVDALVTGDIISINSDGTNKDYKVVVLGDSSSDGLISIADLLKVQKHILNVSSVNNEQLKAMDVNKDNKIDIVDLLKIQKYILGISKF